MRKDHYRSYRLLAAYQAYLDRPLRLAKAR